MLVSKPQGGIRPSLCSDLVEKEFRLYVSACNFARAESRQVRVHRIRSLATDCILYRLGEYCGFLFWNVGQQKPLIDKERFKEIRERKSAVPIKDFRYLFPRNRKNRGRRRLALSLLSSHGFCTKGNIC